LKRTPLAAARSWAGKDSIFLDDADQEIDEQLPLGGRERREDAVVCSEIFGNQASPQSRPACCKVQLAHATIRAIHAAVDQAQRLKLIDNLTRVDRNDADSFGQAALVDTRNSIDASKRGPLERRQVLPDERFGDHRRTDLLKVPR